MQSELEIIAGSEPCEPGRIACIKALNPVIRDLRRQGINPSDIIAALAQLSVAVTHDESRH